MGTWLKLGRLELIRDEGLVLSRISEAQTRVKGGIFKQLRLLYRVTAVVSDHSLLKSFNWAFKRESSLPPTPKPSICGSSN